MEHYFTNNNNLRSEFRTLTYTYEAYSLEFTSDLGVFSKDKLDYGSRLLLENYFKHGKKNVSLLDVGCGYGFLGISLAKIMQTDSTMIDINRRALHLAQRNAKQNKVITTIYESNVYDAVSGVFDVVITNPPIRAGKATVMAILNGAKEYLKPDGELWFVMRKDHGAKSIVEKLKITYNVEILEKSKGFYVIVAKNILTSN